jgi:hypothetical protein
VPQRVCVNGYENFKLDAVLNTFREHDFQGTFKKRQRRLRGDYLEGDGGHGGQ